jgi:uroporphyrinogen decarboxylase
MTHKERFYATINRESVDYPACWLGLPTPSAVPGLLKYFKVNDMLELKRKIDDDIYPIEVPYNNPPTNDIACSLNFAKSGIGGPQDERTLTAPGFFEDITDVSYISKFNWPNPKEHIDVDECRRRVRAVPNDFVKMGILWSAHFQDACSAFGMENALITMYTAPEMFQAVVDRIVEFYLEANEIYYEATKGEIDAILIGNDFGSQNGLMVAPEDLRKFIFPGTKKLIDQAKSYGLTVVHHSCGSIYPIIGDLFDMGADVINPIQALAKDMQAENLKAGFPNKGAFLGGVDAQQLLVYGSTEDVKKAVLHLKELFPTGLALAPSHESVLPETKPENLEMIFKAVRL